MKALLYLLVCCLATVAAGCRDDGQAAPVAEMRTIENTPLQPMPVQPPPQVNEQEALPKPKEPAPGMPVEDAPAEPQKMIELPFAPAIAMDPVDGSKVPIRAETPTFEYKNKIYYFGSAANRQAFAANPEGFLKEKLAKY